MQDNTLNKGKVWLWDMSFEQMSSCLSRLLLPDDDWVPDVIRTYPLLLYCQLTRAVARNEKTN